MNTTDIEWTGTVMLSEQHYDHKPTDWECNKMKFTTTTVDLNGLSDMIVDGYSFCPTNRKKDFVEDSNMIVVDIDKCDVPMHDFVKNLVYTPSIYYTTFSNNEVEHKYRFRLIYAIEGHTSGVNSYNAVFEYIVGANRLRELLPDNKSVDKLQANQMYHGSYECEIHNTGLVYKVPEFLLVNTDEINKCERGNHISEEMKMMFMHYKRIGAFLSEYEYKYGNPGVLTETPYVPSEIEGMLVPYGQYMVVPRKYGWFDQRTKRKVYVKWKDGYNRHGKLWLAGLIIRKLNPYLSEDELFFGFVDYIYKYIDLFNSDKSLKYTREKIIDDFNAVMDVPIEDFEIKVEMKHSGFRVDERYCMSKGISKTEGRIEILHALKENRYEVIDSFYDPNIKKTRKQWLSFLSDNGVKISMRTFCRFLNEYGYSKVRK